MLLLFYANECASSLYKEEKAATICFKNYLRHKKKNLLAEYGPRYFKSVSMFHFMFHVMYSQWNQEHVRMYIMFKFLLGGPRRNNSQQ